MFNLIFVFALNGLAAADEDLSSLPARANAIEIDQRRHKVNSKTHFVLRAPAFGVGGTWLSAPAGGHTWVQRHVGGDVMVQLSERYTLGFSWHTSQSLQAKVGLLYRQSSQTEQRVLRGISATQDIRIRMSRFVDRGPVWGEPIRWYWGGAAGIQNRRVRLRLEGETRNLSDDAASNLDVESALVDFGWVPVVEGHVGVRSVLNHFLSVDLEGAVWASWLDSQNILGIRSALLPRSQQSALIGARLTLYIAIHL